MLQCPARDHWRSTFLNKLKQHLQHIKTPLDLQQQVLSTFKDRLNTRNRYAGHYYFTLFAGLLPKTWQHDTSSTISHNPDNDPRWAKTLSSWLIQQGYNLWTVRNHDIYGNKTPSTMNVFLNQKIQHLYSLQTESAVNFQVILIIVIIIYFPSILLLSWQSTFTRKKFIQHYFV